MSEIVLELSINCLWSIFVFLSLKSKKNMILVIIFFSKEILVKPVTWIEKTKKKGFIIYSSSAKAVFFPYKRTAFFSGTPNLFGPSYLKVALVWKFLRNLLTKWKTSTYVNVQTIEGNFLRLVWGENKVKVGFLFQELISSIWTKIVSLKKYMFGSSS